MRCWAAFLIFSATASAQTPLNYEHIADRIVSALNLRKGERVLTRFDPGYFRELVEPLRARIRQAGATPLAPLEYVPKGTAGPVTSKLLESVDVYLWLPLRENERAVTPEEQTALGQWLDRGGSRREIHFHWPSGSVLPDGLATEHPAVLDAVYQDALDIDYGALSARQNRAIQALRSGLVRVRTKAGTDLSFRTGGRPFNKQDGDASPERMRAAIVRVDREIELPAGVLRVAPIEETANGVIVVPEARFGGQVALNVKFYIERGKVVRIEADKNLAAVQAELEAGGAAALQFREFGAGFNLKLKPRPDSPILPYFGYGTGVIRLSLGDNQELGGAVHGSFRRWFFFPDATVEVNGNTLEW